MIKMLAGTGRRRPKLIIKLRAGAICAHGKCELVHFGISTSEVQPILSRILNLGFQSLILPSLTYFD